MDIFDMIDEATTEANAFENHAAKSLSLEERLLYLQGLALVMNADSDIDAEEKEYIRILIKSFEMDESILDDFVAFAQSPDKDTVQSFFRTFRRRPIAQLFLFDALMLSRRDGSVDEKETAVINKIAEQLEILKGTQQDIYDLFCHIKNRNWQESALYFSSHLLNPAHFKHLLDYHELDFDQLMAETETIRQSRLLEVIRGKLSADFEWEALTYRNNECMPENVSEITTDFVDMSSVFNAELILPYLQARLDSGELRVSNNMVYFTEVTTESEGEFFNLDNSGFNYNQEDMSFYSLPEKQEGVEIPAAVIVAAISFLLPEIDINKPEDINIILAGLFNATMAVSKKYASNDNDVHFPTYKNSYTKEILLHYADKKFILRNGSSYVVRDHVEYLTPSTIPHVLMSNNFRLIR